jgi:heat-inducible transcriptional repressor
MGVSPKMKRNIVKTIQVVPVEAGKVLVILVIDTGVVKNNIVIIKEELSSGMLIKICNMLNKKYGGLPVEKIAASSKGGHITIPGILDDTVGRILDAVNECIRKVQNLEVYLEGATNILNYPEFKDVLKAQEFLNVLDEKELLRKLLSYSKKNGGIKISIGSENEIDKIKDCTLITAEYSMGEVVIGSIGVIGPTRMKYSKVISSMNYVRRKISDELRKMLGELY